MHDRILWGRTYVHAYAHIHTYMHTRTQVEQHGLEAWCTHTHMQTRSADATLYIRAYMIETLVCLVLSVNAAYAHITHYVVRVWAHTYIHAQYLCNFDASAAVCCTKNISAPTYKRHCQLVRLCSYMQQKSNGLHPPTAKGT